MGVIQSLRAGVSIESVRRPMSYTKVEESKINLDNDESDREQRSA